MKLSRSLVTYFEKLVATNQLSHGYLLCGGGTVADTRLKKQAFIVSLAHFIEKGSWEALKQPLNDFLIIEREAKVSIGIDVVRRIKAFLYQRPNVSLYRIAAVFDAHLLTPEAQNALLKIVEEPPDKGILFFVTHHEDDMAPALTSRLQKIFFFSHSIEEVGNLKKKRSVRTRISSFEAKTDDDVNRIFEKIIGDLRKDVIGNVDKLRAVFSRLISMKRFSTNRKLQMRALLRSLE